MCAALFTNRPLQLSVALLQWRTNLEQEHSEIHVFEMQCPAPDAFVRLSADNRRFDLDGAPFFFTGCNSYYLMTRAAEPNLRQQVLEVLDDAKAAGVRVIRTWAFNDGQEWNALQPAPG